MKKIFFLGCVASLLLVAGCGDDKDKDNNNVIGGACTPSCVNNVGTSCDANGNKVVANCGTKGCNADGICNTAGEKCTKDKCQGRYIIRCNNGVSAAPDLCPDGCDANATPNACKGGCAGDKCEGGKLYKCSGGNYAANGTACASGICAADGKSCADCNGNEDICKDSKVYACNNSKLGTVKETCTKGCNTDNKTCKPECTADTCKSEIVNNDYVSSLYTCNGGKLNKSDTWCLNGCANDGKSCLPKCQKTTCDKGVLEICGSDGVTDFFSCGKNGCNGDANCKCETDYCEVDEKGDGYLYKCSGEKLATTAEKCPNGCMNDTACRPKCTGDTCDIDGVSLLKCNKGVTSRETCELGCEDGACKKCSGDVCKVNKVYACNGGTLATTAKTTCKKGCNDAGTDCIPETVTENYCVGSTLVKPDGTSVYCKAGCDSEKKDCKDESSVATDRFDLNLNPVPANQQNYEGASCNYDTFVEYCADAHTVVSCDCKEYDYEEGKCKKSAVIHTACPYVDDYNNTVLMTCLTETVSNSGKNTADCYAVCEEVGEEDTYCGVDMDYYEEYDDESDYFFQYSCKKSMYGNVWYYDEFPCATACDENAKTCSQKSKTCSSMNLDEDEEKCVGGNVLYCDYADEMAHVINCYGEGCTEVKEYGFAACGIFDF